MAVVKAADETDVPFIKPAEAVHVAIEEHEMKSVGRGAEPDSGGDLRSFRKNPSLATSSLHEVSKTF